MEFSAALAEKPAALSSFPGLHKEISHSSGREGFSREHKSQSERRSTDERQKSDLDNREENVWDQVSELSEEAKLELRVFKRVHLLNGSEFVRAVQYTQHVRMKPPFEDTPIPGRKHCNRSRL
jgi:hypothetical protein